MAVAPMVAYAAVLRKPTARSAKLQAARGDESAQRRLEDWNRKYPPSELPEEEGIGAAMDQPVIQHAPVPDSPKANRINGREGPKRRGLA